MARTRYFDYRSPDSTRLLNEWRRGIFQAGVYFGFNAVPGSSGLQISITMDPDPDNTGSVLGSLITHDGVVIQEDADLTDVATVPTAHPTLDRIDYLVATYIYNAGLPNNDVTYEVIQGTAGAPPTPPVLSDDQVLIAQIYLPPATTTLLASMITDVNKKNLFAPTPLDLESILRTGVYTGFYLRRGTAANQVTLTGGTLLTKQERRIEDTTQADLFTLTNTTSANHYRYDYVVMLHKFEDLESNPPDYIVVEGTEADESAGGVATIPDDADILAAATAFDPKYTSNDHFTKLGYVRVQGTGGSMLTERHHTPRFLQDAVFYVSSGKISSTSLGSYARSPFVQHWPFTGHEGLQSALSTLESLVNNYYGGDLEDEPLIDGAKVKLLVDGTFHLTPDEIVGIPSFVEVEGVGTSTFEMELQSSDISVALGGHSSMSGTYTIKRSGDGVPQTSVPGGFERIEISLDDAAAKGSTEDVVGGLTALRFTGNVLSGDPLYLMGTGLSTPAAGWFEEYSTTVIADGDFTLRAVIPSSTPAFTLEEVYLGKTRNSIKNIHVNQTDISPKGYLTTRMLSHGEIDNIRVPAYDSDQGTESLQVGKLESYTNGWVLGQVHTDLRRGGNSYESILVTAAATLASLQVIVGSSAGAIVEQNAHIGSIVMDGGGFDVTFILGFSESAVGSVFFKNIVSGSAQIQSVNTFIGAVEVNEKNSSSGVDLAVQGDDLLISSVRVNDGDLFLGAFGLDNIVGFATADNINVTGESHSYILREVSRDTDEDRNIQIISDAQFAWNATSGELSWDADILIDLPYLDGENTLEVASSPVTLGTDRDLLVLTLKRDNASGVLTPLIITAPNQPSRRSTGALILARRFSNKLYLFDGTVIPDGGSFQLGDASPGDGSVTYPKLNETAKEYVNASLEHWFAHNDEYVEDNQEVTRLDLVAKGVLTQSTGEVNFRGVLFTGGGADDMTVSGTSTATQTTKYKVEIDAEGTPDTFEWSKDIGAGYVVQASGVPITGAAQLLDNGLSVTFVGTDNHDLGDFWEFTTADLSSIKKNDTFIDSSGNRHWVMSLDDGADSIFVHPGAAPAVDPWTYGSIVRGNIAWGNINLAGFSFSPTGPITGTITYSGSPDLTAAADGYLFRDAAGTLYPITAVGAGTLTITNVSSTPVNSPIVNQLDGAIILNNNPRRLSLYDMKPVIGYEVVTFDTGATLHADFEGRVDNVQALPHAIVGSADKRIRVYAEDLESRQQYEGGVLPTGGFIEITAWMTGLAWLRHSGTGGSIGSMYVDGKFVSGLETSIVAQGTTTRYAPSWDLSNGVRNLTPGIHTVRFPIGSISIYGFVIFNQANTSDEQFVEVPGALFADQGKFLQGRDDSMTLPSLSSRGGKLVRYVPAADPTTRAWAQKDITVFETDGDTSAASPTVTNVGDLSGLQVGDIIRFVYASGDSERRRVTTVGVSSFDVDTNPTNSELDVVVKYVGSTLLSLAESSLNGIHGFEHTGEQVAAVLPVHFPSSIEEIFPTHVGPRVDLAPSDGHHILFLEDGSGDVNLTLLGGVRTPTFFLNEAGDKCRLTFVGTGVDVILAGSGQVDITVDGISLGTVSQATIEAASSGQILAGDGRIVVKLLRGLSYEQHVVELEYNTDTLEIQGFLTYEPEDPDFTGYPLWKSNYLAETLTELAYSGDSFQSGHVMLPPHLSIGAGSLGGKYGTLLNPDPDFGSAPFLSWAGRTMETFILFGFPFEFLIFQIPFYGDSVFIKGTTTSASLPIEILDFDDVWRSPSTFLGDTVTGPDTVTSGSFEVLLKFTRPDLHMVRIGVTSSPDSGTHNVVVYGFNPKFHINQRKELIAGSAFLQPRPGGRDVRQLKAYELPQFKGPRRFHEELISGDTDFGFHRVYSTGAWYSIALSGYITYAGAQSPVEIVTLQHSPETSDRVPPSLLSVEVSTADNKALFDKSIVVYLPQGFHVFFVNTSSSDKSDHLIDIVATPIPELSNQTGVRRATLNLIPEYTPEDEVL